MLETILISSTTLVVALAMQAIRLKRERRKN